MKKVLMINWDGHPNISSGGVYSWEKTLIDNMPHYEFIIFNLLSNSNANGKFTLPNHVKQVIAIPLFGSNRYQEFANAIVKVLTDHKLRYELEASALRRVKELFTIEKMNEQYRTEYWNLIYKKHIGNSDELIQLQNATKYEGKRKKSRAPIQRYISI